MVVYALLVWAAARSLYFPVKYPAGQWQARETLGGEDVFLTAKDGTRLHAWLIRARGSPVMTLHLHGNAGNLTHRTLAARHILEAGSSVLLLDYRGYGRSQGRPSEKGLYLDADAAYDYLMALGASKIVLHGESLGTAVAVDLASRRRCAGVVLEAPFPSARAVAGRVLPLLGPLVMWGFDCQSKIRSVRAPLFVIHGDSDEVIAYELGRALFDAAPEPKSMWTVRGATHNDLHLAGGAEFAARLRDFYRSLD